MAGTCDLAESGRIAARPHCGQLKLFLEVGDALYTSSYYFCQECRRVWCHTIVTYTTYENYWQIPTPDDLQRTLQYFVPEVFSGEFSQDQMESWIIELKREISCVSPI